MTGIIDSFIVDGEHTFLSNFYPSPISDGTWPDIKYATVEHFFAAQKSLDPEERRKIAEASTPGRAKRLGRTLALRPDWEQIKYDVMRLAIDAKFWPETELAQQLIDTGDTYLIEGNTWGDRVWGKVNGVGNNWLGIILMGRRAALQYLAS